MLVTHSIRSARTEVIADNLDSRGSVKTVTGAAVFITGQTTTRAGAGHRSPHRLMPAAASRLLGGALTLSKMPSDDPKIRIR